MLKRFIVLACALVVGAAAPARAWCEATCQAPVRASDDTAKPHCSAHDPATTGSSMSATQIDDCPVLDSARPTAQARLDVLVVASASIVPTGHSAISSVPSSLRPGVTTVFQRCTPLRI